MKRARCAPVVASLVTFLLAGGATSGTAQLVWDDLTFTGGLSVETYDGNFSAVTVPVVDSTDHASAAVGEFGARGRFRVPAARLTLAFDLGLRQFAAAGFELRDYAPREWVGRVDAGWRVASGRVGSLDFTGTVQGREVEDRPPMPLYLQPGYRTVRLGAIYRSPLVQDVRFDFTVDGETTDYQAPELLSQLDLLDRRSLGFEGGVAFGPLAADPRGGGWQLRIHAAYRESEFRDQASFDPTDPFRRDETVDVGGFWTYEGPAYYARVGVEGTVNRSNSSRPEYDALSARSEFYTGLPWWDLGLNFLAVVTGKTYVHEVPFTRLVPGEEADNASVVFLDLTRPFSTTLDAAVRFGWTRAETEIGGAYYSRFGLSVLLNYRPPEL